MLNMLMTQFSLPVQMTPSVVYDTFSNSWLHESASSSMVPSVSSSLSTLLSQFHFLLPLTLTLTATAHSVLLFSLLLLIQLHWTFRSLHFPVPSIWAHLLFPPTRQSLMSTIDVLKPLPPLKPSIHSSDIHLSHRDSSFGFIPKSSNPSSFTVRNLKLTHQHKLLKLTAYIVRPFANFFKLKVPTTIELSLLRILLAPMTSSFILRIQSSPHAFLL